MGMHRISTKVGKLRAALSRMEREMRDLSMENRENRELLFFGFFRR
jgi:hypothetical protein